MTEAKSLSAVWRALTTPMGPRIVPRLPGLSRVVYPARVIGESGLPREAKELVGVVVTRTRLWRSEQVDVARELCSHFADGIAAGRSEAELIRDFGELRETAALIRRAKQRQRSIVWQAWAGVRRAAAAVAVVALVIYAALVVRYFTGTALIAHDYSAEIAAPGVGVAEGDRAWPLYERALSKLGPYAPAEMDWGSVMPGDGQWPLVEEQLSRSAEVLELARQGAARPALGFDLRRRVGGSEPGWDPLESTCRHASLSIL